MALLDEFSSDNNPVGKLATNLRDSFTQNGSTPVEYSLKQTSPKSMNIKISDFVVGGALPSNSPAYVKRPADEELFNWILARQFCYVFAPHHMGKSSLMLRTSELLQEQGVNPVTIDFSGINAGVDIT